MGDAQLVDVVGVDRVGVALRERGRGVALPLAHAGQCQALEGLDHVLAGLERGDLGAQRARGRVEEKAVAAFGLGEVGRHQRQVLRERAGEVEEVLRAPALEFQLEFADLRLALDALRGAHMHRAGVDHQQDGHARLRDESPRLAAEAGGEHRHQFCAVAFEQTRGGGVVDRREIEAAGPRGLPLRPLRQPAARYRRAFHRLQHLAALAAGAHGHLARLELQLRGVVVGVVEGEGVVAFLRRGHQRVAAQRRERAPGQRELEFDFVAHGGRPRAGAGRQVPWILDAGPRGVMRAFAT